MGRRLVVAALLVTCAAGCKKTLHWKAIEDTLTAKIGEHYAVKGVTCPETEVRVNLQFDCVLHLTDGDDAPIHVELMDLAGSYRWQLGDL